MNDSSDPAEAFERLWTDGSPPDLDAFLNALGDVDTVQLGKLARIDQGERWRRGDRRSAEEYFDRCPGLQADHENAIDLIYHEYLIRERLAERPTLEEFSSRFPQHAAAIARQIGLHRALLHESETVSGLVTPRAETPSLGHSRRPSLPELPPQFGRYRVLKLLGSGGMGAVYLVEDAQLGRQVALKLPRVDRDASPHACERFRHEARIAATFNHPNLCPVYDFGELEGTLYLTMPCMAGQPLSTRLQAGPLPQKEAVEVARKIARAMSMAHLAGVVHRDLKPSNVFLREDGEPVVMDFGLAQRELELDPERNDPGRLVGTLAYMPPEQLASADQEASPAGDVYSLGVILYETLTGRRPFEGSWREVLQQVQSQPPTAPSQHVPAVPAGLDQICMQALAKHPPERFASMDALADALAEFERVQARRRRRLTTVAVAAALVAAAVGWFAWQTANLRWARGQVAEIVEMAKQGRFFEAYDLAVRVRHHLPDEPKLTRLMPLVSDSLSVTSEPAGARVYLKRCAADPTGGAPSRTLVGTTPLSEFEVARGSYIVSVEKTGYVPFEGSWAGPAGGGTEAPIIFPPIPIEVSLTPARAARAGMVFVPPDIEEYYLRARRRPTDAKVRLDGYFIDKCEVTNRQYQEFVDGGGYLDERYWPGPFVENGRNLSRQLAMGKLIDRTGKAGPRRWSNQHFPEGKADHPVTGVTWYEAAAYAVWREKSLPTIFQWEKAARNGTNNPLDVTMPWGLLMGSTDGRANFDSRGTVPVGSLEFGMSPFGCYEMAGNVSEWCLNETSQGFITSGGSWGDLGYEFGYFGTYPGFYASDRLGFRCVLNLPGGVDPGTMPIDLDDEVPQYTPKPESTVKSWFSHYDYEKTPLQARVVDVQDSHEWRREKIEYNGTNRERVIAYLYLPKRFPGPHQVIHFVPGGDVRFSFRSLRQSIEADYGALIREGRGVFAVVLRGSIERDGPPGWKWPDNDSPRYLDEVARNIIEMRRGLDYLETRGDVDATRIAYLKASASSYTLIPPAVEPRYRSVILWGANLRKAETQVPEQASAIHFVPLIRAPTLHIHGRYDETTPLATEAEPLFNLLQADDKRMEIFEGGHVPAPAFLAETVNAWLDKTLGPVAPSG